MTGPATILVVDDKPDNAYMLQALLTGHGFHVEIASQGTEALEMARKSPPQLCITDLLMPIMDGYTMLRHWKADPILSNVPVIVYTATYIDPEDEHLALALGADAFLVKPTQPEDMMAVVQDVLAHRAKPATLTDIDQDHLLLDQYNATLVRKLEQKSIELESSNRLLREEAEAHQALLLMRASILDALPAQVALIDHDGYIIAVNSSWQSFLQQHGQLVADTVVGGNYLDACRAADLWLPDVGQSLEDDVRSVLDGQTPMFEREYSVAPDPLAPPLHLRLIVTPIQHMHRIGAVVTRLDISEQRAVEEQLRQAQRLEAVGQLTGGVAHDFNNLLTVIMGNAELLEDHLQNNPSQRRLAGMIIRAAQRGADLTRQLLAFSRSQPLLPTVVDINLLLVALEDLLERAVGPTVAVTVQRSPGLWSTLVDHGQLENALINLALNARDSMPSGGALTIASRNVPSDDERFSRPSYLRAGEYILMTVSDTGCGMDEATIRRAFEPFFTTKEVGKGSGLGLSMVYGFAQQSQGAVRLHSIPGEGTTVELWLPRSVQTAAVEVPPSLALPHGSEHLLIVEDDPMVRAQVVDQLEALGYTVTCSENGVEALERIKQNADYDLLFSDVVMPGGLDGAALAHAAVKLRPDLAVLLTSGIANRLERPAGADIRRFLMLAKPYRREQLATMLRQALGQMRAEPSES